MKLMTHITAVALAVASSGSALAAQFEFTSKLTDGDTLVLFQATDTKTEFKFLDKDTRTQLNKAVKATAFSAEYGKSLEVLAPIDSDYDRIVLVGLGETDELTIAKMAKLGGNVHASLAQKKANKVVMAFEKVSGLANNSELAAQFAHGANLRDHRFETYKASKTTTSISYTFDVADDNATSKLYKQLANIEQGVFLARDLTSEIASEMTPVDFAQAAKSLEQYGVKVTVLEPNEIKALGMGALEGVGRGSKDGARLVVAHYKGSDEAPIALVGKGITFDSGGYSIKTGKTIALMKGDMAGAAAVLGTVKAMALNKTKVNVVAVMGMAANMVSENAIAPGDVLRTAEGLNVEVLNTDAEGRLVLSDAMWYARKHFNPEIMIDVATLTGSKIRAVGDRYSAIFSDDKHLVKELTMAGKQVNEQVWRLPLGYKDMLKSDIADLTNLGSGGPGATTAASFLQHFAGDTRWVHIDMAGNELSSVAAGEVPTGGTGYGVRLLSEWLLSNQ
ncbi:MULTISPECIES: leucyl aminopeptidase family protein [Pseudoalteromonas]|uniref:Probable cytosol aminopeptidase n=1 Tax=Pseudoalteromonas amylolytica TaxID=1859457 RepID=A0A1S1MPC4_9GAMM|nr:MULTISPECIES: leucyl aminopeptidase family protein [Pseudoalteromonas]OHU86996.1 leucyl aminopeptidase [Pseudoalteromonas sp. JW3]OHU88295.1 leucyl aminopeptidase [Pseudoalteromonas amylolytica]